MVQRLIYIVDKIDDEELTMISTYCENINLLWGQLLIEELSRLGITDICIAPGSRSTPLTIAASEHGEITTHCHFDERGLGYFALGLAKGLQRGVAIITTSGGAVANLHPAIIEARMSQVPLIVLSADRPNELIACGANQAINQQSLFGDSVCYQINLSPPTTEVSPPYLLTSIDIAFEKMQQNCLPVHINCMFREPFYPNGTLINFHNYLSPLDQWQSSQRAYTQYQTAVMNEYIDSSTEDLSLLDALHNKHVLIICGQLKHPHISDEIAQLAEKQDWALFLDCQSSAKGHRHAIHYYDQLLHCDSFKERLSQAEFIIQLGAQVISKRLGQFIASAKAQYWLVNEGCERLDPNHRVAQRFMMSAQQWLHSLKYDTQDESKNDNTEQRWADELKNLDQHAARLISDYDLEYNALSEYSVVRSLATLLPKQSMLFLGNSMPVRLFDMFCIPQSQSLKVFTNRGASGIDGLAATAIGTATAFKDETMTLIIGDTSLLHDLNSLALLNTMAQNFIIIVLNNDGGAIFNMLAVPDEDQLREKFYQMPHGLTFECTAAMFNLPYFSPHSLAEFSDSYQTCLSLNKPSIIEINVPSNQTTDMVIDIGRKLSESALLSSI